MSRRRKFRFRKSESEAVGSVCAHDEEMAVDLVMMPKQRRIRSAKREQELTAYGFVFTADGVCNHETLGYWIDR